jgi:hypothetical protein
VRLAAAAAAADTATIINRTIFNKNMDLPVLARVLAEVLLSI